MDWKKLRIKMWKVQMRVLFCILYRVAGTLGTQEKAARNGYIDLVTRMEDEGYDTLEGGF